MMTTVVEIDATEVDTIYYSEWGTDHRILLDNTYVILTEGQIKKLQMDLKSYLKELEDER